MTEQAEPHLGQIVTFDCEDDPNLRLVATYVPGGVNDEGEFIECGWIDSYGGWFTLDHINANNPIVVHGGKRD